MRAKRRQLHTIVEWANEGVDYTYTVKSPTDTRGQDVEAILFDSDGKNERIVATRKGVDAGIEMDLLLSIRDEAPDSYLLEVWADRGGDNQEIIWPPENYEVQIIIQQRYGVDNE